MPKFDRPLLWVFAQIETLWPNVDRPQGLISNCERLKREGYNGLMIWDSDFSKPTIPSDSAEGYEYFNEWCLKNDWTFGIQAFPQGEQLEQRYQSARTPVSRKRIARMMGLPTSSPRNSYSICDWIDARASNDILEKGGEYLCLADPRVHPIYEKILKNITNLLGKDSALVALMCYYDEIREQGTHPRCRKPGGQLLSAHVRRTIEIIREGAPWLWPMVWNDMFDPNHNAVTPYKGYPVYKGWEGSWEGIDKDVLILNWNTPNRSTSEEDFLESVDFWNERGNPQVVASYYDGAGGDGTTSQKELHAKREAQKRSRVVGQCYCTWPPYNNINRTKEYLTKDGWDSLPSPQSESGGTDYDFLKEGNHATDKEREKN